MTAKQRRATVALGSGLALLLAACVGGSAAPTSSHRTGGPSTQPTHHHDAQPRPKHASTHGGSQPKPGSSGSNHHVTAGGTSASGSGHSTTGTSRSGDHRRPNPTGPKPVTTGTYTYRQSGSQTIAGMSSGFDPKGTLSVAQPRANGRQTSHMVIDSQQPPSDQTIQFNRHGMFLLASVQRYKFAGHTETIRCHFHPGLPLPPWPLKVGMTFHGSGDCGNIHVSGTGQVISRRTATVGRVAVPVFVIKSTLKTSGGVRSTTTDTEWFSPALRLSVKDVGDTKGKFGPFPFASHFTRTLSSTRPR